MRLSVEASSDKGKFYVTSTIRAVKTSQYVLLFVIIPKRLTFPGVKLLAPAFKIDKRN